MPTVAVIGAGPAGSIAALCLARRGWSVTLIEQHRFPRDKVCGECLSALGIKSLDRLGLSEGLRSLNPVILTHAAIYGANGRASRFSLASPMWGISRWAMDAYLLDAARRAGAQVLQPTRCELLEADGLRLRVRNLETNELQTIRSDRVIVADGKGSLANLPRVPIGDFGIKAHFERVDGPHDTIELFGCSGFYGGLAAIEGGRWNVAFSVPSHRLRHNQGNIQSLFDEIITQNRALAVRFRGARRLSDWLAAPLPRYAVRHSLPPGMIAVGNAAAALEPIGGEGMGLAIRSAELAADSIATTDGDSVSMRVLTTRYNRLWRSRRASFRAAAIIISTPPLARALLPLLERMSQTATFSLRMIGK